MKIRTQLLIANALSIFLIFIFLMVSYFCMLLPDDAIMMLTFVTAIAGILSFFVHGMLIRPIEKAVAQMKDESKKIADGYFNGKVSLIGPKECRQLAGNFNEMSRKLEESFTKLQRSEASRKELIANVSHDLRTPLASIQSFVEALQDDVIEDKDVFDQYLKTIQSETKRLGYLIHDLFQLTQLESEVEVFDPEPYHVDKLLIEALENQYVYMEEKELHVQVDIPEKLPIVAVMPEKMMRVLVNLLQNAIRYSMSGDTLNIVAEEEAKMIRISITDEGEGIPLEEQSFIFERFYRVEKSRSKEYGGSGLGLAICKSIVELHGGRIGVVSEQGEGSTFYFTIPICKELSRS
jgi:two-component system, OmpR family, sensor histidine kinase SaeS